MVIFLNTLFYIFLVGPPVFYILLQWKEDKFHFQWAGVLVIIWNISTTIGNYLQLNGEHNAVFYVFANLLFQFCVLIFLNSIQLRSRVWATLALISSWFAAFIAYSGSPVLYKSYNMATAFSSICFVIFLFYALFKLIEKYKHLDMRHIEEFWFLLGLIIYFTWINYGDLLIYVNGVQEEFKLGFYIFGTAIAAAFFCIGLYQWARNKGLRGVFNIHTVNRLL